MLKWGRKYKLTIEVNEENGKTTTLEITNPLTIEFFIDKNVNSQCNSMDLKIYNLAESSRKLLVQDKFNMTDWGSGKRYRKVVLQAGYGKNIPIIFAGNLVEGFSFRQGTEVITQLHCFDGLYGMGNSFANFVLNQGVSKQDSLSRLISTFNKIEKGIITKIDGELKRGTMFSDNTYVLIKENYGQHLTSNNGTLYTTNYDIFVENEKINIIGKNEYIDKGYVMEISSDSGLLNVPMRRETLLECDMIFEPNLMCGQILELKSSFNKYFNGTYKLYGFTHSGIISDSVDGEAKTTLQLYIGTKILNGLKAI